MLIDGQKWACEACIRGHRVASCKHHDRPLIRIKRKGRPFATCSICHATPCDSPTEHARLKREAELKSPSSKKASHGRLYPRHPNPTGFLPIAPRPAGASKDSPSSATPSGPSSSTHTPLPADLSARHGVLEVGGDWSGSESESSRQVMSSSSGSPGKGKGSSSLANPDQALSHSAPGTFTEGLLFPNETPVALPYSLAPSSSSSVSDAQAVQTMPLVSPLEGANSFDIPLDPALALDDGSFAYLDDLDVDMSEALSEEVFHVEDWSRYMWSPETGFEHLDTGMPPGAT